MISKLRAGWDTLSRASSNSSITTLDKLEEALSLTLSITSCMMILWICLSMLWSFVASVLCSSKPKLCYNKGVLGTPLWFARGCENAAGKSSRDGTQQQGPISPNHVRAIKGSPVCVLVLNII